jgi:hypothetical protein
MKHAGPGVRGIKTRGVKDNEDMLVESIVKTNQRNRNC